MSDHDRGAYTPQTDAPLAFDARQSRRGGGGGGPPTTLIISGLVLLLVLGGIYVFYWGGVRGANEPPQVVGAPVGAVKSAAPPVADEVDQAAALGVYKSGDGAPPSTPSFAPGPEQPLPRPAPRPTLRVDRSDLPPAAGPPLAVGPTPPQPVAKPIVVAKAPPAPKPVETAGPPPALPKAPQPVPAASGPAVVQIGAFSSPALANAGWETVAAAFPADMAGKGRKVEAVPGAALSRSLVTGFPSREAAMAFCGKLKAAGRSCIVK